MGLVEQEGLVEHRMVYSALTDLGCLQHVVIDPLERYIVFLAELSNAFLAVSLEHLLPGHIHKWVVVPHIHDSAFGKLFDERRAN